MPYRAPEAGVTYDPGKGGTKPKRRKARRKKPVQVSVPYAPTRKGKAAERKARGKVKVPYAPTPTGKAAERQGARRAAKADQRQAKRKAKRAEDKALDVLRKAPPTPAAVVQEAKRGVKPELSKGYRKAFPRASKRADKEFIKSIARKEGVKEDPLAEFVISTVATAGLGAAAKGAATLGKSALAARAGSKLASTGVTAAEKAAETGVKAVARKAAGGVKARAGAKAKRIKTTPERVKTAPKRAKKAASTKQGRRKAAKGAAQKAKRHPVRTSYGAAAASPVPLPGEADKRARAFAEGHAKALIENPGKTLATTGRAIPGIVTAPAALLGSAGSSIIHGTPEPLKQEASKQAEGLAEIGEKLFSGDTEKVQKTVEDEVGLSFVAPLPAASRLKKTKGYQRTRGRVRGRVAEKRGKTRAKRQQELRAYKRGSQTKRPRKIRHAVLDTATGEERVLRRTGKRLEGRKARKAVATSMGRYKAQGQREGLLASKDVVRALRRSKLTSGKLRRRDMRGHDVGDVVATVAQNGISRRTDRATTQLNNLERAIGKVDPDEIPLDMVNDLANIKWLRDHPEAFKDRGFWEAVDAYKRQAKEIEFSGRKKVLAIGDTYGLKRPEELLEEGVQVGNRAIKTPFYKDEATLQRKQAELSDLRLAAKQNRERSLGAPQQRAQRQQIADELGGKAKKLERELKDYRAGFKQAQKNYVREAQGVIQREGLEQPAYVKDVKPRQGLDPAQPWPGARPSRKQWMARAEQARRGTVMARDFETLVNQSIAEPRMRRAMHRATTEFAETNAIEVGGTRYPTSEQVARAINRGDLDPEQYVSLDAQFVKQAILDPNKSGQKFLDEIREMADRPLTADILGQANVKGRKQIVVPKEAGLEFIHQMDSPKGVDRIFGSANRLLSRVILGYSPAWAIAQLVAEGIPAALSIGTNPARIARVAKYMLKEDRKLSRKDRAVLDGTIGESTGVTPHPQVQFKPDTNLNASHFFRLSERNPIGRALLKGASGEALGVFNRYTGGKWRKAVAAAKADRELNTFVKSLGELMRGQRNIAEAIKGKPLKAQMEYIAQHPKAAAKLEEYLDGVMGNWRALTRHEAKLAPLIVFYPFVRYSLRWTFWSFPKNHPVKAQMLYFLSQQNAEELEKLAGGPLQSPLEYTFPAYTTSTGDTAVLPGGSRVAPGMNAITTAIGKGQIEGLASALNPALGMGISLVTGVDPFTGEKEAESPLEHGLLALNQLLSLPAPARVSVPGLGNSLRDRLLALAGDEPSIASKAFKATDPNRDIRSVGFPFLPQSGEKFKAGQQLSKAFETKYGEGDIPGPFDSELVQELLYGGPGGTPKPAMLPEVLRKVHASERASDRVKAAEARFLPPSKDFSPVQQQLLQAVEEAYKTGPNAEAEGGSKYSGSSKYSSDNKYLEGNKYLSGNKYAE